MKRNGHIDLLLSIGELDWVFKGGDIETLLQNIVRIVAKHMKADVCSVYFYDDAAGELILRANVGLTSDVIGKLRMKIGEGIAGASLAKGEPICTEDGFAHPDFKYFKGSNEELFKSFLAVPIMKGTSRIGVLMLQRKKKTPFHQNDILALRVITSQLASVIENAKLILSLQKHEKEPSPPAFDTAFLKGKSAARGYAYAKVAVINAERRFRSLENVTFSRHYTLSDYTEALALTERQMEALQKQAEILVSDAASMIFTSHLLILKDRSFQESVTGLIKKGKNAPEAVVAAGKKYIDIFSSSKNEYLREKTQDIEDIVTRIVSNIVKNEFKLPGLKGRIVIADEMYPSDILRLSSEQVKGVVLTGGGVTSHVAILARSLQIPMIIVNEKGLLTLSSETKLLIDAEIGNIYVHPDKTIVAEFKDRLEQPNTGKPTQAMEPATFTKDHIRVKLLSNVNLLKDIELLRHLSTDGIGLYRSEFPFIIRKSFPTEEEQYFVYRKLVEGMKGKEVTFRTLDIGGDKVLSYYQATKKENPFLGMRSIRFSLKHRQVFADQVRAILRAGDGAELSIMFPMIFSVEEFNEARSVVTTCIDALVAEGKAHNSHPRIGMMVEIPGVIDLIEEFAQVSDFFSIGTNDLVQYMLAVDRTNEEVADYYIPHHPAVLRAIKKVVDGAAKHHREVVVCGDMAQSPLYIPFLIGAGVRSLSMNPAYLADNQRFIMTIDANSAKKNTELVLRSGSIRENAELLGILKTTAK